MLVALPKSPKDTLTQEEADRARALVLAHGLEVAARMLEICDVRTLERAIARTGSSRLTVVVIRSRLERRI